MKRIGIVAHTAEGGGLCFLTVCREGQAIMGPHMHPEVVLSAIPMGLSLPGYESGDHQVVAEHLRRGVEQVAEAGADFFICPANTAHIVLETIADSLPVPGLHIAHVVSHEMSMRGWKNAGLMGTKWTMSGPMYGRALQRQGLSHVIPQPATMARIDAAIFDELVQGVFKPETTQFFIGATDELRAAGADCVILGCTEIPLIIDGSNSRLPPLDSTRLLARYAVAIAIRDSELQTNSGWISNLPVLE
jgi:aspartate racemase